MQYFLRRWLDFLISGICALFALDLLLKHLAVWHFFRRSTPPAPRVWPTVTLLQPVTRGASDLLISLRARAQLDYPAEVQHVLICDASDEQALSIVSTYLAEFPRLWAELVLVPSENGFSQVATKIRKLQAALPRVRGEVLCFVDDDVAPRPGTLLTLIPHLYQDGVGAAFGLPCYTNWCTPWASLMSGFVNAHMLLDFVALTYLSEPFRLTGHFVAFQLTNFLKVGGLEGLEHFIDDDFELARRLRSCKLRAVQTPLVYDIDNDLPTLRAYETQLKRWFVLPRQAMLPSLSLWERVVASGTTTTLVFPSALLLLTLFTRRRTALVALLASLGVFGMSYTIGERVYLKGRTPLVRWPLLLVVALLTPLDIARHLLSNGEIEWRGQRLLIQRDGRMEVKR